MKRLIFNLFSLITSIVSAQTITSNQTGTHNGYYYSFWTEGGGTASMTLGAGGNYSTSWTNIQNFTAGKGWRTGTRDRVVCFEGTYNGGSNGFLAVYGWTKDPLIEYYVVESQGQWDPPGNTSDIESLGSFFSDGDTYDVYRSQRVNKPSIIGNATFYQFWSVRRTKRSSGTVNFKNHVDKWESFGLKLGTTWDYQIMESEGYGSSGSSNITVLTCNTCATAAPTVTASVTYEVGETAKQLTATGTSLKWYTTETGGTASTTAPTPSTTSVGTTLYYVSSTANGCESSRSAISVKVVSTYKIYKVTSPVAIDGSIDDVWSNALVAPMNATKLLTGTVTNTTDLSGYAKLLWDNTNLYFLANVTDANKINDSQNVYDDDAVELYIDPDNTKATAYDANDIQYSFGWNDGTTIVTIPSTGSKTNVSYVALSTSTGYIVEAKIPWTTLSTTASANKVLGIDFMINDDDDSGTRDGKLSWNAATDQAWTDASLFGTGKLLDQQIVTDYSDTQDESKIFFPNPVQNSLQFSNKGEIFNLNGTLLLEGTNEINVEKLESGCYLFRNNNKIFKIIKE
ncbi:MAG: glycoside hydrolase family 11 protein [Cytophagales bacterium]